MEIVYRKAGLTDLDGIAALARQAAARMAHEGIDQWDEFYPLPEDFERDIMENHLTVGMLDGEIAVMYTVNGENEPEYESAKWKYPHMPYCILHRLCVNPLFQRRGIARQTMAYMEREAAERGARAIRLDVFSQNFHALRLYQRGGYDKVGTAQWRKGLFYLMEKYLERV